MMICSTGFTMQAETAIAEHEISRLIHHFYELALRDGDLNPIFESAIADWDRLHRLVVDFWSHTLLGTNRYQGSRYPVHERLPLNPEHFMRRLLLFRRAVEEVLSDEAARSAISRAEHMSRSFIAGMSPFSGPLPPLRVRRA